ncbi:MAG: SDR family NAD(P)-dependent oxidoreductase [Patescibacteria group bacterium]
MKEVKTVVVTGGSDGLGKALVDSLVASGFRVVNVSRRKNDKADVNILSDLSTADGIKNATESILKIETPLKAIIYSAGVLSFNDASSVNEIDYERVFSINTKAPMFMTSELLDRLKTDETDIVIINSVAGIQSYPAQILYNSSKAALHSYTKDLRETLSSTASRVIGIYPGMLDTDMAQKIPDGAMPKSKHPAISPTALADYIVYTINLPKVMEVSDIVINRKKRSTHI